MTKKSYYIAIDKMSKRYKVFEDREQGFKLTAIKHCKHFYISLNDFKSSLKISAAGFTKLKKNLAELFKGKRVIYNIKVINGDKNTTLPFVKEIMLYEYIHKKKAYLHKNDKKEAFKQWYSSVLFSPSHERYDFTQILFDTYEKQNPKEVWDMQMIERFRNSMNKNKNAPENVDNSAFLPTQNQSTSLFAINDKISVRIDGREIEFEIDKTNEKVYCYSDDLAKVCRRPYDYMSWTIFRILKKLDKLGLTNENEHFEPINEVENYKIATHTIYKLTRKAVVYISMYNKQNNDNDNGERRYSEVIKAFQTLENEYYKNKEQENLTSINFDQEEELDNTTIQNSSQNTTLEGEFDISLFEKTNLGKIRVKGDSEEPLFCLSDICRILELTTPAKIADMVKSEFELYELNSYSFDTGRGVKEMTMVTEPQLYFVLMRSDKPKARPFRQWVVNEILPSIRKQGKYEYKEQKAVPNAQHSQEELVSELLKQNNMLLQYILKNKQEI